MIQNQNIVITGASSGIGKSILEMLAARGNGNRIVAASRSIGKLTGFGENVILFPCDLSTKEGVDALFEKAAEVFLPRSFFGARPESARPPWPG
ncbi:MAG: SDR family oxidoreductase [Clostridia bacterium]|nr:SDR family oxidoreductase [Clostridia bacterium]